MGTEVRVIWRKSYRWNVLEVKALPPFLNLEALGFPSHMDLLSFNTGAGKAMDVLETERIIHDHFL